MFHIAFYVPKNHAEQVKEKMFEAGAGKIGNYDCCSFESLGTGQFRPLPGSRPFLGSQDVVEQVEELKVEMMCEKEFLQGALSALKQSHPYETPAYYVVEVLTL